MEPKTPKELYWAKMAGEDVTLPEPKTPEEAYLAKMAGDDIALPDPKTPKEYYMKSVAENGGFGGDWQEVNLITVDNLEWILAPDSTEYGALIEQEIDVELGDFIICTIGDDFVQYHSVCMYEGADVLRLVSSYIDMPYQVIYRMEDHLVVISIGSSDTAPTASSFILSKLTKTNSSSNTNPDEPGPNPGGDDPGDEIQK